MGAKITVDCATMMNKGLEVIEAMWLFDCLASDIEVIIHPQSIIHSMVEYADNALIAQLSNPSMDIPIQLALSYPERLNGSTKKLDFSSLCLDFHKPDFNRYPCLKLALEVAAMGMNYPCAMSGANEIAVELFLNGKIKFTQISKYVRHAIELVIPKEPTFERLVETDRLAREAVITAYKEKKFE
jgi:1-deoxy-D-xylulose-5-phosphate reductoisomerase